MPQYGGNVPDLCISPFVAQLFLIDEGNLSVEGKWDYICAKSSKQDPGNAHKRTLSLLLLKILILHHSL